MLKDLFYRYFGKAFLRGLDLVMLTCMFQDVDHGDNDDDDDDEEEDLITTKQNIQTVVGGATSMEEVESTPIIKPTSVSTQHTGFF